MTIKTPLPYSPDELQGDNRYWWQHLTWYHWFVVLVASMAWFFDCLDQRIFSLAQSSAFMPLRPMELRQKKFRISAKSSRLSS